MGTFWNDPAIILILLLGILVADNLWSTYLLLREICIVYKVHQVPDILRPYLTQELFSSMRTVKLHKCWFTIVNNLLVVVISGCLELYFGFYALLWTATDYVAYARWMKHEVVLSIIYISIVSMYIMLKSLPGQLYERLYIMTLINRPKMTCASWVITAIIDMVVSMLCMALLVAAVVLMVQYIGHYSFVGLYFGTILITIGMVLMIPLVIDPFIGTRVALQNMELAAGLKQLTEKVGFPISQVYIIQVRDPSVGSNAFFVGFGPFKRIVIFDTLLYNRGLKDLSQLSPQEQGKGLQDQLVLAVVAHELGHWKHCHFFKALIMFKLHLLATFGLLALLFSHGPIYQAVGFEEGVQPIIVGFFIIPAFAMIPYFTFSNVLMLSVTRQFEYQADRFAHKLNYAANLRQALLKLYADNLSFPISDECYSSWNHTHPTVLHRIKRLESLEAART